CLAGGSTNRLLNESSTNRTLSEIKILDPACGSGAFPCSVMNIILQRMSEGKTLTSAERYQAKLKILQNVIYGVDIQPMAVQIAMLRLFLSLIQEIQPDKSKYNFGIESLPNLDYKFVAANTLKRIEIEGLFFHSFKIWFQEVLELKSDYFAQTDYVKREHLRKRIYRLEKDLGDKSDNEGIQALCEWNNSETQASPYFDSRWMFGIEKFDIIIGNPPYIQKKPAELSDYPLTGGNNNTYVAFTERSLQITAKNGIVALIIPYSWFSGEKFSEFRNYVLDNTDLFQVVQLPYDMFRSAYIDTAMVFMRNAKPSGTTEFCKYEIRHKLEKGIHCTLEPFPTAEWKKFGKIFLSIPLLKPGKKFWFARRNVKLGNIAKVQRGCRPPKPEQLSDKKTAKHNLRYFNGQIFRYTIRQNEKPVYVCYDELVENKPLYLFQTKKKILGRQLISRQFRMNLTYIEGEFVFKTNLYAIYDLDEKFDYFYILGILNSKLFSFMQVNFNASLQRDDFPIFSLDAYRNFPIPNILQPEQKPMINLVRERLAATPEESVKLDEQIDALVYELYGLTDEERDFIKNYEIKFRIDE
ncbi:MAG: N-6 DNA methylase, partial [Planctomycetaceae bacterium]|nr:N-6 DNA methylase [Planctomycetaceae bacterium]